MRQSGLFGLVILAALVLDQLAPLFWACGEIGLQVVTCSRAKQASLCSESKKSQEECGSFNYLLGCFSSNLNNLLLCLLLLSDYRVVCALYVQGSMYHRTSVEARGWLCRLPSLLPPSHELQGLNSVSRLVRQALLYLWAILWPFFFIFFIQWWGLIYKLHVSYSAIFQTLGIS